MKCNLVVFQRCHSFWRRNARRSEHDHEATSTQVKKRSLPVKGWRSLWLEGEKVIETELDKGRNHQLDEYVDQVDLLNHCCKEFAWFQRFVAGCLFEISQW